MHITVKAGWDAEAKVWYIASTDLPGLHRRCYSQGSFTINCLERSKICWKALGSKILFKFIIPGHKSVPGHVKIAA